MLLREIQKASFLDKNVRFSTKKNHVVWQNNDIHSNFILMPQNQTAYYTFSSDTKFVLIGPIVLELLVILGREFSLRATLFGIAHLLIYRCVSCLIFIFNFICYIKHFDKKIAFPEQVHTQKYMCYIVENLMSNSLSAFHN